VILTLCQPLHVTASCLKSLGTRRLGSIHLKKIWALRLRTLNVPLLTQRSLFRTDTQRGVVTGLSRDRNLRSKIWWFTEFCNSHYVSHFAAFFIVTGTKISIAKSCFLFRIFFDSWKPKKESGQCLKKVLEKNTDRAHGFDTAWLVSISHVLHVNPNQPGQLVGTMMVHRGVETLDTY
jgi:hypothetical protein